MNIYVFNNWRKLIDLKSLDAIIVCTTHNLHSIIIKECIKKNLHVFVEKPASINDLQSKQILKLLKTLGLHNAKFYKTTSVTPFNENVLAIFVGKQKIGLIGEIDLSVTDKLIKKEAFGFEIYPEKISLFLENPKIKKTSKFPLSSRDINIILDKSITYQEVESLISKGAIKHLTSFNLINTFEGKDIPKGSVSMTLRFIFQSNTKSLLESEINESIQIILKLLEKRLNAKIRS